MSNSVEQNQPYTFRDPIIKGFKSLLEVIINHRKQLFIFLMVGGLLGFAYSYLRPITYKTQIKFFVEDSKSAGGGLMSMVAGQIGIDVGSLMGGNSVLAGDNVLELAKSKILLQKALQTLPCWKKWYSKRPGWNRIVVLLSRIDSCSEESQHHFGSSH